MACSWIMDSSPLCYLFQVFHSNIFKLAIWKPKIENGNHYPDKQTMMPTGYVSTKKSGAWTRSLPPRNYLLLTHFLATRCSRLSLEPILGLRSAEKSLGTETPYCEANARNSAYHRNVSPSRHLAAVHSMENTPSGQREASWQTTDAFSSLLCSLLFCSVPALIPQSQPGWQFPLCVSPLRRKKDQV